MSTSKAVKMVAEVPIVSLASRHELFRGMLQPSVVPVPFSAASQQATRLAAAGDDAFVFATGQSVFRLRCSMTLQRSQEPGSQTFGSGAAVSAAIADDYMVPRSFASLDVEPFLPHSAHQAEVQSVAADSSRVATVDAYGTCIVTVGGCDETNRDDVDRASLRGVDSFVLHPVSLTAGEPGWAGVTLRRDDPGVAVVAREFFRDLTLYDRDVPARTVHTLLSPSGLSFCGNESTVAVSEGADMALYDLRAGERGSCAARKTVTTSRLLALDTSADGTLVAVAGMDRIVHVYDVRTMSVRDRWPACLKYECAGLALSREMDGMVYVCSVDNEVACGAWSEDAAAVLSAAPAGSKSLMISGANTKSPRRAFGFRADVSLMGIARRTDARGDEEVAVMSEAGAFYMLRRKL